MKRFIILLLALSVTCLPLEARRRWIPKASSSAYNPASDATVVQWLKADSISPTTGTDVQTWTASTGQNAVQNTVGNRPTWNSGDSPSGLPSMNFHDTTATRFMTTASFGTLTQPYRVWIVFKLSDNTSLRAIFDGLTASDRALFGYDNGNDKLFLFSQAAFGYDANVTDTNWHIAQLVFSGATSTIALDNGAVNTTSASPGTGNFVGMTIGQAYDNTLPAKCKIGEIIVQNSTATSASGIWTYLNSRWTVY